MDFKIIIVLGGDTVFLDLSTEESGIRNKYTGRGEDVVAVLGRRAKLEKEFFLSVSKTW